MTTIVDPYNAQEKRVRSAYGRLSEGQSDFCGCNLCRSDTIALALNRLPAAYRQRGTVVLRPSGPDQDKIDEAVREALSIVSSHPKH